MVTIVGVGGLGHLAIQYAVAMEIQVIAVDTGESKMALTKTLGAEYSIDYREEKPSLRIKELVICNKETLLVVL